MSARLRKAMYRGTEHIENVGAAMTAASTLVLGGLVLLGLLGITE
jgi:hypothetical protein